MSNKRISIIITSIITALFAVFVTVNILTPAKDFSETENRALAQKPSFSFLDIVNGNYMKNFESYVTDKFVARDFFVSFKALAERITGKSENNGVYFAQDKYLIEKPASFDKTSLDVNLDSIKTFSKLQRYNITVSVIPTAFEIENQRLPYGAYNETVTTEIDYIKNSLKDTGINFVDTTDILKQNSDKYLYYRTDHHQTAHGSYYVYNALGEALGYKPYIREAFDITTLSDMFLGTTWSKAMLKEPEYDQILKYTLKAYIPSCTITFPTEENLETATDVYNYQQLNTKDKYSVYLGGNHPVQVIKSSCGGGRSIAVFKDSYANSILPFLVTHFENIHVIDLRYYNNDIIEYLYKNKLSDILFLYNTSTFMTDTTIEKLGNYAKSSEFSKTAYGTVPKSKPVDMSYFDNAAFAGDSLTEGLRISTTLEDHADFFCSVGASLTGASSVRNVRGKKGDKVSITEALTQNKYGKIYIMLGINDGQNPDFLETYLGNYKNLISEIKKKNPDTVIYIQAIMPVTQRKESGSVFKNHNIYNYNEHLRELAQDEEVYYLPVYEPFVGEDGYLNPDITPDGVHLTGENYQGWVDYLINHTVPDTKTLEDNNSDKKKETKFTGTSKIDPQKLFDAISNDIKFEDEIKKASINSIFASYGIEIEKLSNGAIYSGSGITAEEVAIFEVNSKKDVEKVKKAVEKHIEDKKKAYEGYVPKELTKLKNPTIVVKNNVVVLCISNNDSVSEKAINEFLK